MLRDMVTPLGVDLMSVAVIVVVSAESWSAAIHQLQCSHATATSIDHCGVDETTLRDNPMTENAVQVASVRRRVESSRRSHASPSKSQIG